MEASLNTHPSTAIQASAFTSPASLSFPGGAGDLTPPSEKDGNMQANGASAYTGQQLKGADASNGSGVTPTTPAATPGAGQGVSGIVPTLQNIVSTINLACRLDLKTIALHARNAEYNPKRFAAVIMRIREPKTTALIFASGKMVVTGAKSEDDSKLASRKYARIIQKLGFNAKFTDFKIQNIVGSCDIKFPIRLEGLASRHHHFSSYEPELFPGLIYRMIKPKIVLLIFVSGKIVLTGAKVREEIYSAFELIYPVLTAVGHDIEDSFNPHGASIDTSRVIRADYSNPVYTSLASQAQERWRNDDALSKHYHECGLAVVGSKGQNGWEYIEKSKHNVANGAPRTQDQGSIHENVQTLENEAAIQKILCTDGGSSGEAGYLNRRSGWANAEGAMLTTRTRVTALARTQARPLWQRGQVSRLLFAPQNLPSPRVIGVQLIDGIALHAELTILATGAWTPSLLDLRGRLEASAQVVAYISLSGPEAQRLRTMPVLLNFATGMFAIPPPPSSSSPTAPNPHLKIARHAYGYRNPTPIHDRVASLPAAQFSPIPPEGEDACRGFLAGLVPWLAERPFSSTRLCWYADTPGGNFLVDYHPEVEGLFLATGGSGHAFKFLPVLGERVVEALEGRLEGGLRDCWRWVGAVEGFEGTEDGSRGEGRGVLGVEMARGEGGGEGRRGGGSKL
ncbi:MAG: hypothetical protein Q9195_002023 [Heterodermia aff. obscurata]